MKPKEKIDTVLDKSSDLASSFTERLQQSWRNYAIGAALLLSVSLLLLWSAVYRPLAGGAEGTVFTNEPTSQTENGPARALDGVLVEDASSTHLLPLAVMVENSADAWPLMGPAKANLVYEAPVEGSITRLMLVFDPTNETEAIGPVRSARSYYVDWVEALHALYGHVGGSPAALEQIARTKDFRDLNEFYNGSYFYRSAGRSAPHNVFTSVAELADAASDKEWEPGEFRSWLYADAPEEDGDAVLVDHITIPYQGMYEASWEYDADSHVYTRSQNGSVQKDADGEAVRAVNVVVIQTYATVVDAIGRLSMRTEGRGKAYVFHDGRKYEGEWVRKEGEHIRFETVDGKDIPLARGTTWISVLTSGDQMYKVLND